MNFYDWLKLIAELLSVLLIIIPLGIKLYNTVVELTRTKNWPKIIAAVSEYMAEAEELMEFGSDKKAYVMAMVQVTAEQLNYPLKPEDIANISNLIDDLCEMSKVVNSSNEDLEVVIEGEE